MMMLLIQNILFSSFYYIIVILFVADRLHDPKINIINVNLYCPAPNIYFTLCVTRFAGSMMKLLSAVYSLLVQNQYCTKR